MSKLAASAAIATCWGMMYAPTGALAQSSSPPQADAQTAGDAQTAAPPKSSVQIANGAQTASSAQTDFRAVQGAQTGPVSSPDIIVTANRRSESVQRSSLAIQAFTSEGLRSAGLTQATDLNKLVPGLQIATAGSTTQIYIRGVGDFSASPLANPGVAFNVDGVYVGRPEGVASTFYDVARLEVLKGPQGTLYGRNATGGAINLITNSPLLGETRVVLNAEIGDYSLLHFDGAVNIPLSSTVAVRAAFNRITRDGYLTDGTNDDDQLAGRLKLLFKPSEAVSVLLSVDGARIRGNNAGYVYLPRRPGSSAWEGTTSPGAVAYTATFDPLIAPPAPNFITDPGGNRNTFVHNNFYNVSAQIDWNLQFATLTIVPAYRHTSISSLSYDAESQGLVGHADQTTLEARLGNSGERLKWTAGAYFFHEHNPGTAGIIVGPALLTEESDYDPKGTSYAVFGEATAKVTAAFRLIGGARYTTEERSLSGGNFLYPTGTASVRVPLETYNGSKRFNSFTWKAGAEYDVASQNLLFATASTGFKSGGLTQTVFPASIYRPEKILAFEIGSRNRFLNNRLQVNIELFHWTYRDQQNSFIAFDSLGILNFLTINAGRSRIYGANADIVARFTSADTIHLSGEYAHSRYSDFTFTTPSFAYNPAAVGCRNAGTIAGSFVPLVVNDCSGLPLPHVAKWSGVADYTHSFDLSSGAIIAFTASARASSARYLSIEFTRAERAPAFVVLSSEITYHAPNGKFSLGAFVRNINNGKEYTGGQQTTFSAPQFSAIIGPPRTYGVRAGLRF